MTRAIHMDVVFCLASSCGTILYDDGRWKIKGTCAALQRATNKDFLSDGSFQEAVGSGKFCLLACVRVCVCVV